MAEDIGNRICSAAGIDLSCTTAAIPLSAQPQPPWKPAANYQKIEEHRQFLAPVCECESVAQSDLVELIEQRGITCLHDLRRRLRIGFGPCQGTFCASRVAALILRYHPDYSAIDDLGRFWAERLKGNRLTAWGPQARQALLSDTVYCETLGLRLDEKIATPGSWR